MNSAYFINTESRLFQLGQLIVVSGPDLGEIYSLLLDTRDALAVSGFASMVLDTRTQVRYPMSFSGFSGISGFSGCSGSSGISGFSGFCFGPYAMEGLNGPYSVNGFMGMYGCDLCWESQERPVSFEFLSLVSANSFVVLCGNQFDREDPQQNIWNDSVLVDTVKDIMYAYNIENRAAGNQPLGNYALDEQDGEIREIFPFINRLYYYDTRSGEITRVKTQTPFPG